MMRVLQHNIKASYPAYPGNHASEYLIFGETAQLLLPVRSSTKPQLHTYCKAVDADFPSTREVNHDLIFMIDLMHRSIIFWQIMNLVEYYVDNPAILHLDQNSMQSSFLFLPVI